MKRPTTSLAIVVIGLLSTLCGGPDAAQPAPDKEVKIVVKEDLVYGKVHGAGLLADIAYPEKGGPFPVILSVHGGRWVGETNRTGSTIKVRQWAGFGYFAMSIDYRLLGCSPAPACYQDLLCAIRWVRAHKKDYPIDTDRIFLIGQSAGGHLVSLAGTLGEGTFRRTGGWDDQSHDIRGVISVAGPYDVNKLPWGNGWTPPGEDPFAARRTASPIQNVSARTRPMLIIHSDNDRSVPVEQAVEMVKVLAKNNVRHRFVHYEDKGHMGITADVIREARAFIEEVGGK
jgi:acetyl esterase/lipase